MTEFELLALKEKIETAKERLAELNGALQLKMKQLKDEFNCKTLDEAKKKHILLQKKTKELDYSITRSVEALQKKYKENLNT